MTDAEDIVWHGEHPSDAEAKVRADLADLGANGLERAADLVFHHVTLTDDMDGPSVVVWGDPADNRFHAEYHDCTEWTTFAAWSEAERISAIRERCAKATPGPWSADWIVSGCCFGLFPSEGGEGIGNIHDSFDNDGEANAAFVSHARQDVPDLLALLDARDARVAALEAERDALMAMLRKARAFIPTSGAVFINDPSRRLAALADIDAVLNQESSR